MCKIIGIWEEGNVLFWIGYGYMVNNYELSLGLIQEAEIVW